MINENYWKEYLYFTNNYVESFNHCINQCLNNNSKVSFNKFEEILNYFFIKIDLSKEKSVICGYTEKTLI